MSMCQIFVTGAAGALSSALMLRDLAEFGSQVLLIAAFTVVLIVLLLLGLAAIPGRVRKRKR
jgi:hypothetical protein